MLHHRLALLALCSVLPVPAAAGVADTAAAARHVIGVHVADVDPALAAQLGIRPEQGILVTHVSPGLPADQAGIEPYDVITRVAGQPVASRATLAEVLAGAAPGVEVRLELTRRGTAREVVVRVAAAAATASLRLEAARRSEQGALEESARAAAAEMMERKRTLEQLAAAMDEQRRLLEQAMVTQDGEARAAAGERLAELQQDLRSLPERLARGLAGARDATERFGAAAERARRELAVRLADAGEEFQGLTEQAGQSGLEALLRTRLELERAMQEVSRRLDLPEFRLLEDDAGRLGILIAESGADGAPPQANSVAARLARIEDRLARLEALLEQLAASK